MSQLTSCTLHPFLYSFPNSGGQQQEHPPALCCRLWGSCIMQAAAGEVIACFFPSHFQEFHYGSSQPGLGFKGPSLSNKFLPSFLTHNLSLVKSPDPSCLHCPPWSLPSVSCASFFCTVLFLLAPSLPGNSVCWHLCVRICMLCCVLYMLAPSLPVT